MRIDWRAISGPALTAVTSTISFVVARHFVAVPNPAPLFVCIVALAASISGIASGLISAAIAVAASAVFFLGHRAMPGYDASDLARMGLLAATAAGTAVITGVLRQKWIDAFAWEQKHHATSARLSAALDQVDIGIVLLGPDTRAEFINRAFRDYFQLSDAQAESKPRLSARRTEAMRAGDSTPININLTSGEVLRFSCTALPDGGRMLSYTPVTDLVRHSDDPASVDYYPALRGGDRTFARQLRAAE